MKDLHYYYQSETLLVVSTNNNYNASTSTTKDEDTCSTLLSEDDDNASKETMREYNSVMLNSMPDHIVYYNYDDDIGGEDHEDCFDDCNEKDQYFKVSTPDEDFLENFGGTYYNILNDNDNDNEEEEDDSLHNEDDNYENLFNIELSIDIDFPASSSSSSLRRSTAPKINLTTSAVAPTKSKQRRVSRERLQELSREIVDLRQQIGNFTRR